MKEQHGRAALALKRLLDLVVAAAALVALSPLMALIGLVVRLKLGSPVFFRQQRPGLDGRPFNLVKFRTMTDQRTARGSLLPDADRLPPFGRWLRTTSLDELPELWNVLKGDMSLVGPRPLLMHYLPLYSADEARRHEVRPGLTGWAQINGRNAISWPEKFAHDLWYIDNWSLGLDFRILATSVLSVLSGRGVTAAASATMPEFTGSNESHRQSRGNHGPSTDVEAL
jgi:lipopolysaccharide/colanic/teichoic acid biosynthesis glycosyltransferase